MRRKIGAKGACVRHARTRMLVFPGRRAVGDRRRSLATDAIGLGGGLPQLRTDESPPHAPGPRRRSSLQAARAA